MQNRADRGRHHHTCGRWVGLGSAALVKLLVDTHIWLWALLEPSKVTPTVMARLGPPENELWLSPITNWEALLLIERGRVEVEGDPIRWISDAIRAVPFREAALTHEVAVESRRVELQHQDPADRFLAASAKVYELTLVTADERLMGSDEFIARDGARCRRP